MAQSKIKVEMFNVGFGDCFLVSIPQGARTCRILFDCGRHKGGKIEIGELVGRVVQAAGGPNCRIDVVVGTHRHKDHVNGFNHADWADVEVGEVWMPWTEDPHDKTAAKVRGAHALAAAQAQRAFMGLSASARDAMPGVRDLLDLASLTNEKAMNTLHHGFAGRPRRRFLPDSRQPHRPLQLRNFPEIKFHVMGPPRDEALIKKMEPPKSETFKHLRAALDQGADTSKVHPFADKFFQDEWPTDGLTSGDQKSLRDMAADNGDLSTFAAALDSAINNTSLVIMIEAGSARLLFPADAQFGNWRSIMDDPHWNELLRQTTFLKVGHHASHNATPETLLNEILPKGLPMMVSVEEDVHNLVPLPELLSEFRGKKHRIARSDEPNTATARDFVHADTNSIVAEIPF